MTTTVVIPATGMWPRARDLLAGRGRYSEPLISYAVNAARQTPGVAHVLVATDSNAIASAVVGQCLIWLDNRDNAWCGVQRAARALAVASDDCRAADAILVVEPQEAELRAPDLEILAAMTVRCAANNARPDILMLAAPIENPDDVPRGATLIRENASDPLEFVRARAGHDSLSQWRAVAAYGFAPGLLARVGAVGPSVGSIVDRVEQQAWNEAGFYVVGVPLDRYVRPICSRAEYTAFLARRYG